MLEKDTTHKSAIEARDHFFEAFEEGTLNGRWLGCVFWIDGDGMIQHSFTKRRFPDNDFPKAIDLLKEWSPVKELPDSPLPPVSVPMRDPTIPGPYQVPEVVGFEDTPMEVLGGKSPNEIINEIPLPQGPPKPGPGDTQS